MPDVYAILQMPDVLSTVESTGAVKRPQLMQAIFELQTNPRPPGHEAADEYGDGFAKLIVEKVVPPYHILYRIDEERKRVVVIAVYEKKWS